MFDPSSAYRSTQVTSSSPVGQVILLYEGAIRFGTQHVAALARHDMEAAHRASIRCQEVVSALRESLDMSAGKVSVNLDALYDYILRRLVAGNVAKDPAPTEEALELLRSLLEAWQTIGRQNAQPSPSVPVPVPAATAAPALPATREYASALRGAA